MRSDDDRIVEFDDEWPPEPADDDDGGEAVPRGSHAGDGRDGVDDRYLEDRPPHWA